MSRNHKQEPGYKSRIQHADAEYFNLSDKETRIATAKWQQKAPTLEQIKHVIKKMPAGTEIERRHRTLVAFTLLTGARDSAIASLKLKHVDLIAGCVNQDAREVKTKFSKTLFQSSQLQKYPCPAWPGDLQDPGTVQGLEPKPGTRESPNDLFELWRGRVPASRGNHP